MAETVQWNFNPFREVRLDAPGEIIFMQKWHKRMGGDPQPMPDRYDVENYAHEFPILEMFNAYWRPPNARQTQVVSSFILWLGTGNGQAFRAEAQAMVERLGLKEAEDRSDAYISTWAIDNAELKGSWQTGYYYQRDAVMFPEAVTLADISVLDQAVKWLGGEKGQAFLAVCEEAITQHHRRAHALRTLTL